MPTSKGYATPDAQSPLAPFTFSRREPGPTASNVASSTTNWARRAQAERAETAMRASRRVIAERVACSMEITPKTMPERLVSLDAFRGAVMALMVLVNTPGDGAHTYAPLQHAEWHGWTITDVVFPSFVWIVGVAITLSLGKRMAAGASRMQLMRGVLRRASIFWERC